MRNSSPKVVAFLSGMVLISFDSTALAAPDQSIRISSNCWGNHAYEDSGPKVTVKNLKGKVIRKGGFLPRNIIIEVKSPAGVDSLEITKEAPLIDSEHNMWNGCGAGYIFSDATTFRSSNTYHVDLGELLPKTPLFIQAFDSKGGITINGFLSYAKNSGIAKVSGRLVYPSEYTPAMTIYARNIETGKTYSVHVKEDAGHYVINIPAPGKYIFFSWTDGPDSMGAVHSHCDGSHLPCSNHEPIQIVVQANQTVKDVIVYDYYFSHEEEDKYVPKPP